MFQFGPPSEETMGDEGVNTRSKSNLLIQCRIFLRVGMMLSRCMILAPNTLLTSTFQAKIKWRDEPDILPIRVFKMYDLLNGMMVHLGDPQLGATLYSAGGDHALEPVCQ